MHGAQNNRNGLNSIYPFSFLRGSGMTPLSSGISFVSIGLERGDVPFCWRYYLVIIYVRGIIGGFPSL